MGSTHAGSERDEAKWYWDADAWSTGQKLTFWMWFFAFCPVCLILLGQEPEGRWRRRTPEERAKWLAAEEAGRRRREEEQAREDAVCRWRVGEPDLFRLESRPEFERYVRVAGMEEGRSGGSNKWFIEDSPTAATSSCPCCGTAVPNVMRLGAFDEAEEFEWQQCPRCHAVFNPFPKTRDPYYFSLSDWRESVAADARLKRLEAKDPDFVARYRAVRNAWLRRPGSDPERDDLRARYGNLTVIKGRFTSGSVPERRRASEPGEDDSVPR